MAKVYRIVFEDYRDTSNIVNEEQFIVADCIEDIAEELRGEGEGYDKELIEIREVIPSVRFLKDK